MCVVDRLCVNMFWAKEAETHKVDYKRGREETPILVAGLYFWLSACLLLLLERCWVDRGRLSKVRNKALPYMQLELVEL